MKRNEYNYFDETQNFQEYQKIDYIKNPNNKEIYSPNSEVLISNEYGEDKLKKRSSIKKDTSAIRKLVQKVTETASSIAGGIAATATVAVTSIILFTSIVINPPKIELLNLDVGYDYVSYNLYIDEMNESMEYYSIVSNNDDSYEFELTEGENKTTVYNLKHGLEYELSVIGIGNEDGEVVKYYNKKFYTNIENNNIIVKWIVEGQVVEEDEIEYGEEPIYNGATPTKKSENEISYTFLQWNKTIEANGDITYIAEFESSVRIYKVKWIVEGIVVEEDEIEYGEEPIYNGVTPVKEMTLDEEYEFIGWDKEVTIVTEDTVYVAVFNTIIHEYVASYNQLEASNVQINYNNESYYRLFFNTRYSSTDERLGYRIILTDVDTNEQYIYEGTDTIGIINVPKIVETVSITYESYGIYNEQEKIYDTVIMNDLLTFINNEVEFSDSIDLIANHMYQLSMVINSTSLNTETNNTVTLLITYDDSSTDEIILNDVAINDEIYFNVLVPTYCRSFIIEYTVDVLDASGVNETVITGSKEFKLTSNYKFISLMVDNNESGKANFLFIYHMTDESTTIAVKNKNTNNIVTMDEGYNEISIEIDNSVTENTLSYYISDLDGNAIGVQTDVVVSTSEVSGEYNFDYVNPNDAIVTYNSDNTMNIYLDTVFETEDSSLGYIVRYNDFESGVIYEMEYNESKAYLENVPISNYGIVYYVYKTINGIHYQLSSIFVSGGIEVSYGTNYS